VNLFTVVKISSWLHNYSPSVSVLLSVILLLYMTDGCNMTELIDKCVGSRIWVIMKGDKGIGIAGMSSLYGF
jgi:hypothetical protein